MKIINWNFVISAIAAGFLTMMAICFALMTGCTIEGDDKKTDGNDDTERIEDSESGESDTDSGTESDSENETDSDTDSGTEPDTDSETEINPSICDCLRGLIDPPAAQPGSYCFNIEGRWFSGLGEMTVTLRSSALTCLTDFSGDGAYLAGIFEGTTLPLRRDSIIHSIREDEVSVTVDEKLVQSDKPKEGY